MAVALVANAQGRASDFFTSHTIAFDVGTVGANGALYVGVRAAGGEDVTSVTHNGDSLTFVATVGAVEIWRRVAPDTGSANVVVNISGGGNRVFYAFSSWSGVDQTTPEGTAVTATGTSATPSTGSVTCPTDGAVLGVLYHFYSGADATNTAGTLIGNSRDGNGVTFAHAYRTTTGAVSWGNLENYAWEAIGIPINAAGGGGGGSNVPLNILVPQQGIFLASSHGR